MATTPYPAEDPEKIPAVDIDDPDYEEPIEDPDSGELPIDDPDEDLDDEDDEDEDEDDEDDDEIADEEPVRA